MQPYWPVLEDLSKRRVQCRLKGVRVYAMFRASLDETRAGLYLPSRVFAKVLPWLRRTFRTLVLDALFANALVNFDFELLPLATVQHRLDGQPVEGRSRPT
jgi:hypothetical protein